jgi:hypothetical protein
MPWFAGFCFVLATIIEDAVTSAPDYAKGIAGALLDGVAHFPAEEDPPSVLRIVRERRRRPIVGRDRRPEDRVDTRARRTREFLRENGLQLRDRRQPPVARLRQGEREATRVFIEPVIRTGARQTVRVHIDPEIGDVFVLYGRVVGLSSFPTARP